MSHTNNSKTANFDVSFAETTQRNRLNHNVSPDSSPFSSNSSQPLVQGRRPSQPFVQGRRPSQPFVQGRRPSQPFVQGRRPSQPLVQERRPSQPFVQGRRPSQPLVQERRPSQPLVQERRPSQPFIQGRRTSQPLVQGRRPSQPLVRPERRRPSRAMIHDKDPAFLHTRIRNENVSCFKEIFEYFKYGKRMHYWRLFSNIITFWAPSFLLSKLGGMKKPVVRQAWREKAWLIFYANLVTLCLMIAFVSCILGFLSIGLRELICSREDVSTIIPFSQQLPPDYTLVKTFIDNPIIYGNIYDFKKLSNFFNTLRMNLTNDYKNADLSAIFDNTNGNCEQFDIPRNVTFSCKVKNPFGEDSLQMPAGTCIPIKNLNVKPIASLAFGWNDLKPNKLNDWKPELLVYGSTVINVSSYVDNIANYNDETVPDSTLSFVNNILYDILYTNQTNGSPRSKDISWLASYNRDFKNAIPCILSRYQAGFVLTQTAGCYINTSVAIFTTGTIVILTMVRIIVAVLFTFTFSKKLVKVSDSGEMIDDPLYTVMLVTAYSEDKNSLQTTLDSLVKTDYSDDHKLFFIVVDGMIKGKGNKRYTSDICINFLELDPEMRNATPCSYVAIADGEKRFNRAKVVRAPAIIVVKIGSEKEINSPKPGNRGKRDSQMIVMSFFEHVYFNERFTELDYELFWKIYYLLGITADHFELILMVDADTKVAPSSLTYLVSAMNKDPTIMGCCGETRIANKTETWVTAIQVYEYYISHHLGKAFESAFGSVTCLPGCFCMYRLKAPKDDAWVPILSNPDIVAEYQKNIVITLHEKNLLLLGEDRYLSTLMLRTFPYRKMLFVPQAICHTIAPTTFSVLLSQRRRWINSTVHNLFELVLVRDLCGIACLSMQFVIMLDIIGTLILPSALCFTIYLIFNTLLGNEIQYLPLILLAMILGLPGILIVVTTRRIVYLVWMLVYLLALPVWNFILPLYAYWNFDDFSWGETRQVLGDTGKDEHGDVTGRFDSSKLRIKTWEEWENERHCIVRSIEKHETFKHSAKYLSHNSQIRRKPTEIQINSDKF
ncbi:13776_t:CDS:2 [Cetraspora pellucida]|uniref:13776_t:CDS:1 n=1 Tax=Cetraspora pellucida TaxID=1433469 RepID=A0ACA9MYI9_9GLOM|nr:13776_t:CDS:2 [Cetraspora pellucida]